MKYCRLPFTFDAVALARDVAAVPAAAWASHFNTQYHDGGWSGVALHAPGGDPARLYPDLTSGLELADTPLRRACPVIDAALRTFGAALRSARLLTLAAGGCIREHRDYGLNLASGEARLHVPIVSGPGVEFYLDGELVPMEPGECWYLDLDLPHRVQNLGTTDRVHLVVDCAADEWLRAQLPDAGELQRQQRLVEERVARSGSSQQRLERFRRQLLTEPALRAALAAEEDRDRFLARVVDAGRRCGFEFTTEDVRATMDASRRAWSERWIVR